MSDDAPKPLILHVVDSTVRPGLLSLRWGVDDETATNMRRALVAHGFRAGDEVLVTLVKRGATTP